ncbi:MAG: hypothetical protein KDC44_12760 [Phaeodactylibacter sp.]|nr:hypothetical protein [Phaeodactylibacter sp.]
MESSAIFHPMNERAGREYLKYSAILALRGVLLEKQAHPTLLNNSNLASNTIG